MTHGNLVHVVANNTKNSNSNNSSNGSGNGTTTGNSSTSYSDDSMLVVTITAGIQAVYAASDSSRPRRCPEHLDLTQMSRIHWNHWRW